MNERNSETKVINTSLMRVDLSYQQPLSQKRVERIVKNFNDRLVNPPKVSFRDGCYYIFNGQHTTAALKIVKGGGKDINVKCEVYYGLTQADEAVLFALQNGEYVPVRINAKARALYNTGNQGMIDLVNAVKEGGMEVDFSADNSTRNNYINAIGTLIKAYRVLSYKQFVDMISLIRETWGGTPESVRKEILGGMIKFYQAYSGEFNRKVFIKKLGNVHPMQILREGKMIGSHAVTTYARIIVGYYNAKAKTNRLPDKL